MKYFRQLKDAFSHVYSVKYDHISRKWSIKKSNVFSSFYFKWKYKMSHEMNEADVQNLLNPPISVKGMTSLQRSEFLKTVFLPGVNVPTNNLVELKRPEVKECILRLPHFKSVLPSNNENLVSTHKLVLLDPRRSKQFINITSLADVQIEQIKVTLDYTNWNFSQIMKAILPDDASVSAYSIIGHIVHFNLREEVLKYKSVIGTHNHSHR